jgi:hypothetical protein
MKGGIYSLQVIPISFLGAEHFSTFRALGFVSYGLWYLLHDFPVGVLRLQSSSSLLPTLIEHSPYGYELTFGCVLTTANAAGNNCLTFRSTEIEIIK